jgi:hypothetical protein
MIGIWHALFVSWLSIFALLKHGYALASMVVIGDPSTMAMRA